MTTTTTPSAIETSDLIETLCRKHEANAERAVRRVYKVPQPLLDEDDARSLAYMAMWTAVRKDPHSPRLGAKVYRRALWKVRSKLRDLVQAAEEAPPKPGRLPSGEDDSLRRFRHRQASQDRSQRVREALDRLSPVEREVAVLVGLEGKSEVAVQRRLRLSRREYEGYLQRVREELAGI